MVHLQALQQVTLASQKFVNLSQGNNVGAKPATRESTSNIIGDMSRHSQ